MLTLFSLQGAMDIDEGYHLRPWMSVHFCGIAWGIPIAFTCVNIRTGTWFRFDDLLSSTATLLQRFEETGGHAWIFFYFRKARRACRIGARALVDYRFKHRGLGMDLEDMLEIGRAVYTNFNDKVDLYAEEISAASKAALQQQSVGTRQAVWA